MSALAKTNIEIGSMREVFDLAGRLSKARGFVPDQFIGQPDALAAAMLMGLELGMGPMEALRSIHVIKGKPSMSAETMLARAIRAGIKCVWAHTDAERATLIITRDGAQRPPFSFSMDDAKRAGLTGSDNWRKYPAAMLRARCTSAAMRAHCPDVLGSGVYTPDELDSSVRVDAHGEVVATMEPAVQVETPKALPQPTARKLSDCETEEAVVDWCEANRAMLDEHPEKRAKCRAALVSRCAAIGCEPWAAIFAAGLDEDMRPDDGYEGVTSPDDLDFGRKD